MAENQTSCLLCGSPAALRHAEYPGYMKPEKFRIYHCTSCKAAFSLPRTDTSSIYNIIYNNAERVPGYSRYMSYAGIVREISDPLGYLAATFEAYWGVKKVLSENKLPKEHIRILEVGSGLGYLTYSLVKAGYDAKGLDISESAVKQASGRFGNYYLCGDVRQLAISDQGKYDYVISTEVIEHIDDPSGFMGAILSLLKPGGKAIITTPGKSAYPDDIIWASDLPPVHLWWFSEESIKYIASQLNASVKFIDYTSFYRKNYKAAGLKSQRAGRLPSPFFNEEGELIVKSSSGKSSFKHRLQKYAAGSTALFGLFTLFMSMFKRAAGEFRRLTEKNLVIFSARGAILCAVIENK